MDWKSLLTDVRAHLPGAGQGRGQQRGSLRWLEAEMARRGGNPASTRNIIYRDTGTNHDKEVLAAILTDLAREAGRSVTLPRPAPHLPDELELLGRSKKLVYKSFLAAVRAGRAPRVVVSGRPGAGKTVLLGHIAQALEADVRGAALPVTRLNLAGDVFSGEPPAPGGSYTALAARQWDWARTRLPAQGTLLLRVSANLRFAGGPPRLPDGSSVPPAAWAAHLLNILPAGVPVLLALEDAGGWPETQGQVTALLPPTPAEARHYLMEKLGVNRATADQLLRETGRNLDRLTLLAGAGTGAAQLLTDPELHSLVVAVAALRRVQPGLKLAHAALEVALGQPLGDLPLHARAQLNGDAAQGWQPNAPLERLLSAAPDGAVTEAVKRLARAPRAPDLTPWRFAALIESQDWTALTRDLERHVDDRRHLPELWPRIRRTAPTPVRERLAREIVSHHAGRGEYDAPRARDALFSLLESESVAVRAWGRVKLAESSLDAGNFEASARQLENEDVQHLENTLERGNPWVPAAQADALLVRAALARWQGRMEEATRAAFDPRAAPSGPRAELWRGLIAKDAGQWQEAMTHLQAVPGGSPLLHARARYQEGDMRLRLGQTRAALQALQDAAALLRDAGGTADELARILARTATAQRRLGHPRRAWQVSREALDVLGHQEQRHDLILRARLQSEQVPILLALNQPDAALQLAWESLHLLAHTGTRPAEVSYRARRTQYRVALAYLTRGLQVPYLQPLLGGTVDNADLRAARDLLAGLLTRPPDSTDRDNVLTFDMWLSRALAQPEPVQAGLDVERALAMTDHPYAEAQARALKADVHLRAIQVDAALTEINRAYSLLRRVQATLPGPPDAPDPGLHAQLVALEARVQVLEGKPDLNWLSHTLTEPLLHPFQTGIWREIGAELERQGRAPDAWLTRAPELPDPPALRARDLLPLLNAPSPAEPEEPT